MDEAKHSPGPWRTRSIKGGKAIDIVAADDRYVATLSSRVEQEADARLIAAAPEMLDMLCEILADSELELSVGGQSFVNEKRLRALLVRIDGKAG